MNFINFLSNKQMSEEHSDQEDYVGNILDNIHKKVEIYIKTHDIKLFSEVEFILCRKLLRKQI